MFIRPATETDLPQILAIYAPYVTDSSHSLEYTAPDLPEFARRFCKITAQFPWLVWEENGQILGYAYGSLPFERAGYAWCCEASIYLRPDAQRRGIGKALYAALEEILRLQGYCNIYAIITAANDGSIRFHQAMGYRQAARFSRCGFKSGVWLDVIWMEKTLQSVDSPSTRPCSARDIVKNNRKFCDILAKMSLF